MAEFDQSYFNKIVDKNPLEKKELFDDHGRMKEREVVFKLRFSIIIYTTTYTGYYAKKQPLNPYKIILEEAKRVPNYISHYNNYGEETERWEHLELALKNCNGVSHYYIPQGV
jgi:hypothetical protein